MKVLFNICLIFTIVIIIILLYAWIRGVGTKKKFFSLVLTTALLERLDIARITFIKDFPRANDFPMGLQAFFPESFVSRSHFTSSKNLNARMLSKIYLLAR